MPAHSNQGMALQWTCTRPALRGMNITKIYDTLKIMGCVCAKESVTVGERKFFIQGRLGEGGFSMIDLVEDRRNRQLFALKRILCHSEQDEKDGMREVQYMEMFNHSNLVPCEVYSIVPVKSHMTAISELFIVMPYYKKGSINDELERLRGRSLRMPEARIVQMFSGICDAVAVLHSFKPAPIAHRDIKPHNVMLNEVDGEDVPVLMDFGSMGPARCEIKGLSEARTLQDFAAEKCSMPYRAPELFQVESYCTIDERVDIWSLGCTLYAMCFYESPFDKIHQRGDSIALAVMAGNIKAPENHGYSSGLIDLMMNMTVVNPLERPSISVVKNQLNNLQRSIQIQMSAGDAPMLDNAV